MVTESTSVETNSNEVQGANIVLIGAPGSGKGTQSNKLADRYKICQLSTGDLLRQAAQDQTSEEGKTIRETMQAGGLVEDRIVLSLIDQNLDKEQCRNGFLFDGFPRSISQGEQLEQLLKSKNKRLDAVIEYAIPDELLRRRILGRLIHKKSGRTYHEEFHPPKEPMKDDLTGEKLERRSDDTSETLNARLETYHKQTTPLIDFYRKKNLLQSIDATQKVDKVFQQSVEHVETTREKIQEKTIEQTNVQTKQTQKSFVAENNRFNPNFLFVYQSVTSVLREHGLI